MVIGRLRLSDFGVICRLVNRRWTSAVSHCVNEVTDALVKMAPKFISFLTDTASNQTVVLRRGTLSECDWRNWLQIGATWRIRLNLTTCALNGPLQSKTQTANGLVQPFLHIAHGRKSLYFTMGTPIPQNCPFHCPVSKRRRAIKENRELACVRARRLR